MAANSKHWADVREWLYKVINSCATFQQVIAAKRLVRLYIKKHPYKEWGDDQYINNECLIDWCDRKFTDIGNKLKTTNNQQNENH